ncbi:MAG: DNA polymerase Y family protein [Hyphomicrobiaceae bacterium]
MRRYLSLWFPHWPIERLRRESPAAIPPDRPFALVAPLDNRLTLTAVAPGAASLGLAPGMSLADARAAVPGLVSLPAAPGRDRAALLRLAFWSSRYGPTIGLEDPLSHGGGGPRRPSAGKGRDRGGPAARPAAPPPDGIFVEITGVAHLFGGELQLLRDLIGRLAGFGLTVRPAIADTPGAAHAIARHDGTMSLTARIASPGETAHAISGLPVAALRLAPATVSLLARLGLKRIGDLYGLPRSVLARRFSSRAAAEAVLRRLDEALGLRDEPRRGLLPPPAYLARAAFAEPLIDPQGLAAALDGLVHRLAADLAAGEASARRLRLDLYRADGSRARLAVRLGAPSREPAHRGRLIAGRLEGIDLGFGIDLACLTAIALEQESARQTDFSRRAEAESSLARLIDRIANRCEGARLSRLALADSHLPERAGHRTDALEPSLPAAGADHAPGCAPPPPILIDPPEPVAVIAEVPDGPPVSLRWRRVLRPVSRATGPMRIAPEWWRAIGRPGEPRTRDYYTIEDAAGRRYWVFRDGLYGRDEGDSPAWFLHGLF